MDYFALFMFGLFAVWVGFVIWEFRRKKKKEKEIWEAALIAQRSTAKEYRERNMKYARYHAGPTEYFISPPPVDDIGTVTELEFLIGETAGLGASSDMPGDQPAEQVPTFTGFGGGDSDGGGATSNWDAPADTSSCDTSSGDSSTPDCGGSSGDS